MKTYVLYHSNCPDGFGAALAAWMSLGDDDVEYRPVSYGEPLPEMDPDSFVYLLDFSYHLRTMIDLQRRMNGVRLIDHHKTTMDNLSTWDGAKTIDLDHSGAVLAWMHFNKTKLTDPIVLPPLFYRYLEDRDLWRWQLPNSREVAAALASYPADFTTWEGFLMDGAAGVDELAEQGAHLLRAQARIIDAHVEQARLIVLDGYEVPIVNATVHRSEIGEALLEAHPGALFSLSWYRDKDDVYHYSLRSRPDFDVTPIARLFGGGGHPQAAGFETKEPLR